MTKAPFSADQVRALEEWQTGKQKAPADYPFGEFMYHHIFTCANRGDGNHRDNGVDLGALVPTVRGWICPYCDYTQDWCHDLMAAPKPKEQSET